MKSNQKEKKKELAFPNVGHFFFSFPFVSLFSVGSVVEVGWFLFVSLSIYSSLIISLYDFLNAKLSLFTLIKDQFNFSL